MGKDSAINQTDSSLISFLNAIGEEETENELLDLLQRHIQPAIEKNLHAKMHISLQPSDFKSFNQDALEIAGEVKLFILAKLGKLKLNPQESTIQNLNSYVTSITINAYRQFLRGKYPLRRQLKSKLRYLLTHHPNFSLWEDESGWVCGLKQSIKTSKPLDLVKINTLVSDVIKKGNLSESSQTIDLVRTIFEFSVSPLHFHDLVSLVAEIQGIKDQPEMLEFGDNRLELEEISNSDDQIISKIEQQEELKKVWVEICKMPIRHRLALLLNLKDKQGDGVIKLFPLLRIASIRQIAETLDFLPLEFASIWNELPWEDVKIAEFMNLNRQQVVNLRQSARMRLVRKAK